mgnify:CR=1 FL=1
MKDSLEKVYQYHHTNSRKRGQSVLKGLRGDFLRERIGEGKHVLDIGCRDGALTSTYYKGNDVLGVDIDQEALTIVKNDLGINTKQMDLNAEWSLPEGQFDFVVAGEVVEHLYFPELVIQKVAKTLNKDGVFLGSIPNAFSLMNRLRYLFGVKEHTPLADPTHINHFSRQEFEELLNKSFSEVVIYPVGKYAFLERFFPGLFSFVLLFEARKKN